MYNVLIADDEAIVRTMLRSLIDWEAEGFSIVADAMDGRQALEYIKEHPVELLITDIKMPGMDGIELISRIAVQEELPVIIVLSSYDDYPLVRDAFRLGASDYMLKSDLNPAILKQQLTAAARILKNREPLNSAAGFVNGQQEPAVLADPARLLAAVSLGKTECPEDFPPAPFIVTLFEIDDFSNQAIRFGTNMENGLIKPLLSFAGQIPQVASKCIITSLSPSRYVLFCPAGETGLSKQSAVFVSRQIITVWKNCMNISCSGGMSSMGKTQKEYMIRLDEASGRLTLKFIFGRSKLFTEETETLVSVCAATASSARYQGLCRAVKNMDRALLDRMREEIITGFYIRGLEQAKQECLFIIYHISIILQEYNIEFWNIFQQDENYYEKIRRQETLRSLEIWIIEYMRSLMEYMEKKYERKQEDIILRAKQFIFDNYTNPEITLNAVAGYAGFNEKYFSHRFTQETGSTFSSYLTSLRIHKAKELLDKTDLKMYEISEGVGYNSVEHFTRIFKKQCGMSPGEYREQKK